MSTDSPDTVNEKSSRLRIFSLSLHGLIRGRDVELGRDADTGGQVLYVLDQARWLGRHPDVERVDLITRQVWDKRVDESYSVPLEPIDDAARIVRLPFGPRRYLHKETLWPYLPSMVDQIMRHIRSEGRAPDLIHGHYADAGLVGSQVAKILGVPFLFTGHSLGRIKKRRLEEQGHTQDTLENRYRFTQRIEAEERALETAALVVASTRQEVREQYQLYDHYQPERKEVIPPGVDLSRYSPPDAGQTPQAISAEINRFLEDPDKPLIMAMARADERKNLSALVEAFGENPELREKANLLLVVGNRDDIRAMPSGARRVLTEILLLIDRFDLYGSVAYPKEHRPGDVPHLYRMVAASGGLFVNPALTEPFGLTLLEAAASGLPIIATNDGGPQDILDACQNGLLIDPQDSPRMAETLLDALSDRERWDRWSKNGLSGVHRRFTWESHARDYILAARKATTATDQRLSTPTVSGRHRLAGIDRLLVTDVDDTLTGDADALEAFKEALDRSGGHVGFGIATGRTLNRAAEAMRNLGLPIPDILITATGTEIHYGDPLVRDISWQRQIDYRWDPETVRTVLLEIPGISAHERECSTRFRLRFRREIRAGPSLAKIRRILRREGLRVTATLDHHTDLDVTPIRASPGLAIRFLSYKLDLPLDRILVAGDSGNDLDMLSGETLGLVVKNHTAELSELKGRPRIHFAEGRHGWGVLEGLRHYDFFKSIHVPDEDHS